MTVELIWATPNGDDLVARMARVSNPDNENNTETAPRLIRYLIRHKHWSPFEMVNACVKIDAPRDIIRQILRHRSFSFQEFSGRYAEYGSPIEGRECRTVHPTNRQSSLPSSNELQTWWSRTSGDLRDALWSAYEEAIGRGVAKEVARTILPEGFVPSTIYMNGTLRSWIHYWDVRCGPETQKEHRLIAEATREAILKEFPQIKEALDATS